MSAAVVDSFAVNRVSEPEWDALLLAREWGLTAYDAAFLQLALKRKAPLVTLDARLAAAYDKAAARG